MKTYLLLLIVILSIQAFAAEEALDLNQVATPPPAPATAASATVSQVLSQLKLMGRIDLTGEYYPNAPGDNNGFKNYHFFIFLKTSPSEKVSLLAEIVRQTFYDINYKWTDYLKLHIGKIIVPFGDTTNFHHFYGGLQGYGAQGVMFPNIWAEYGISSEWKFANSTTDLYVVSGISTTSLTTDPSFNSPSNNERQAVGLRETYDMDKIKLIASGYYTDWLAGRSIYLIGGDVVTDYRLFDVAVLRSLKFAAGRAIGFVKKGMLGDFQKAGDYVQISTNALPFAETRLRYGTYIDNSLVQTASDTHSINVGMIFPIDVMHLLAEYQWNFEAVNEVNNDVARLMLALDF